MKLSAFEGRQRTAGTMEIVIDGLVQPTEKVVPNLVHGADGISEATALT